MNDDPRAENQPAQNQQLSAALMRMSNDEVTQMLDTIESLQIDLLRLIPLFGGQEPVEAVTYTQYLLTVLNEEINRVLISKQAQDTGDSPQNSGSEETSVDYTPVLRLLSKVTGDKRRLTWTGKNEAE